MTEPIGFPGGLRTAWHRVWHPGLAAGIYLEPELGVSTTLDGSSEVSAEANRGLLGSPFDFAQATSANRFGVDTLNGHTVYTTDGAARLGCIAALSAQRFWHRGPSECWVVASFSNVSTLQVAAGNINTSGAGAQLQAHQTNAVRGTTQGTGGNAATTVPTTLGIGNLRVMRMSFDGTEFLVQQDVTQNTTAGPATIADADAVGTITLGATPNGSNPCLAGAKIAAALWHSARFSALDVSRTLAYFKQRFGSLLVGVP